MNSAAILHKLCIYIFQIKKLTCYFFLPISECFRDNDCAVEVSARYPKHDSRSCDFMVLACSVLHNYLCSERCDNYCPPWYGDTVDTDGNMIPGLWREEGLDGFDDINPTTQRSPTRSASDVHQILASYFSEEGALNWQAAHVTRVWAALTYILYTYNPESKYSISLSCRSHMLYSY